MLIMSNEYIIQIEPARDGMAEEPTQEEAALLEQHFTYLKELTEQGTIVLAGRTTEKPFVGVIIFYANDQDAAQIVMENDPAIKAGIFHATLSSFRIALLQGRE